MKFDIPAAAYPFEHRWLDVPEFGRLHYIDEGEGQTLLLCHGNPTWSFLYRKMIPLLRDDFRCVAVDLPGFGLSEASSTFDFTPRSHASALETVVDHLDLKELIVVGQDWGGPTGLGVAGRRPDRISGVVLGNTFAWPLTDDPRVLRFSRLMGGIVGRTIGWTFNGVVRFFLKEGIRRGLAKADLRWYLAPFAQRESRRPTWIFPAQLSEAVDFLAEVESSLGALRDRPALLVWAEKDFAFREPYRSRFQVMFPNNRIELLPRAGHFWQEDEPARVVEAIRTWVAASPESSTTAENE